MSMRHLPYPHDFEVDHTAAHHEERRRLVLQALDPGDVMNVLDDLLAQEPDPIKHPCFPLVNWLLGRQWAVNGGTFWDQWKQLTLQAIDRLVDTRLQRED